MAEKMYILLLQRRKKLKLFVMLCMHTCSKTKIMMSLICSVSIVDMEEVMYTIKMIKREIKRQPDVDPLENAAE